MKLDIAYHNFPEVVLISLSFVLMRIALVNLYLKLVLFLHDLLFLLLFPLLCMF